MSDYYEIIERYAVHNRLRYGSADVNAVIGKVISEIPEAKRDIKALMKDTMYIVAG